MKYALLPPLPMFLLSACQPAAEAPAEPTNISESDAEIIANRNEVEFTSMDASRIKAPYAADVVAFDPGVPGLMTDREAFDKAQDEFAVQKLDNFQRKERKIQILDADTFIVRARRNWQAPLFRAMPQPSAIRMSMRSRQTKNGRSLTNIFP